MTATTTIPTGSAVASEQGPGWDLVIFDCDGVLIDSELLTIGVEVALLAEAGIAITPDEIIERYVGISMKGMIADLEARFGRPLGDDFAARHALQVSQVFEHELKAMPGIADVLAGLRGHRRQRAGDQGGRGRRDDRDRLYRRQPLPRGGRGAPQSRRGGDHRRGDERDADRDHRAVAAVALMQRRRQTPTLICRRLMPCDRCLP